MSSSPDAQSISIPIVFEVANPPALQLQVPYAAYVEQIQQAIKASVDADMPAILAQIKARVNLVVTRDLDSVVLAAATRLIGDYVRVAITDCDIRASIKARIDTALEGELSSIEARVAKVARETLDDRLLQLSRNPVPRAKRAVRRTLKAAATAKGSKHLLGRPIEELELTIRSANCILGAGIATIGELVERSSGDLLAILNFGRISLKEIEEVLAARGLRLAVPK